MSTLVAHVLARFDGVQADFWDCQEDAEYLSHDSPLEAIEEHLSNALEPGGDVEEQIRQLGPLEVWSWTRNALSDRHVDRATDDLLERASEIIDEDEDLGHPDGDHQCLSDEVIAKYRGEMRSLVERIYAEADVWGCSPGSKVTIEPEELIALVRAELPELLEP